MRSAKKKSLSFLFFLAFLLVAAVLAAFLPPASLEDLCNEIFTRLEATGRSKSQRQSYIQALTSLYRSVGFKLGGQLSRATPLVLAQLQSSGEGDDEVMELCLAALEAFVQRSPGDARPFMGDIMAAALRYMRYDPNYAADEDEDMDEGQSSGDEDYEDEEPYSDDEDTSWKVRRGAAKLAAALVGQYTDVLLDVYRQLGPALVARFKEREEAVRPDVYQAYIDLVASMGAAAHRGDTAADQALSSDVPSVMRAAARQLKTSSPKTKTYVLRALQQLVRAVPAEVTARLGDVLPGVNSALEDKSTAASSLKIEALHFINAALSSSPPSAFQPLAPSIAPAIFAAAGERYYAVAADALRACEQLVRVLRPDPPAPLAPAMQPLVHPLFEAATARVTAQDQPQEVKDAAIGCMAAAVAVLGDIPEENTSQVRLTFVGFMSFRV